MRDVVEIATNVHDIKLMENYFKYHERKRDWKPVVKWYHGSTGSGKTRQAMIEATDPWISGRDGRWYDGYDAHEDVIFDDVRGDFMKFHEWLRVLDRYPYTIEIKGGSRQFLAKRIWITSCYSPREMFKNKTDEDINQLERRIDLIQCFGSEVRGNTSPGLVSRIVGPIEIA